MGVTALSQIRKAVTNLNPKTVRELSERPLNIAIYAAAPEDHRVVEEFLIRNLSPARRREALAALHRGPDPTHGPNFDLAIYDESVLPPRRAFVFQRDKPERFVNKVLDNLDTDIGIALARTFPPFRAPFVKGVIQRTCRENALFSLATALPDIIPSFIELPWAVTEFASDTAVLTANQIRMAFVIAAASDRDVGYRQQKNEIASVIGSAFGWRALARQERQDPLWGRFAAQGRHCLCRHQAGRRFARPLLPNRL